MVGRTAEGRTASERQKERLTRFSSAEGRSATATGPKYYLVELHRVDGLARLVLGLLEPLLELPVQDLALGLLGLELLLEELLPFRRLAPERGERLVQTQP